MNDGDNATISDCIEKESFVTRPQGKKILYGLPCANCRSYYESNLAACPLCCSAERVSDKCEVTRLTAVL